MKDRAEDFILIGKYALNRICQDEFFKLLEQSIGVSMNPAYTENKWFSFKTNTLSFLISHKEFTLEIAKEIERIGYKG